MPNENDPKNQQTEGEAAGATDPKEGVGAATEGNDQQTGKPTEGSGTSPEDGVTDKHGRPGINREKYQRDIQDRDNRIAELEAQLAEAAKTEEGRAEMQQKIDELKQTLEDDRVNHELERAGCVNTKAARAILDDYEGDIDKLKEACPYLFSNEGAKKTGSTGMKPEGSPSNKVDEVLDRVFGK